VLGFDGGDLGVEVCAVFLSRTAVAL